MTATQGLTPKLFPAVGGWVVAQSAGPGTAAHLPRPPGQALALPRSAAAPRHLAPRHLAYLWIALHGLCAFKYRTSTSGTGLPGTA